MRSFQAQQSLEAWSLCEAASADAPVAQPSTSPSLRASREHLVAARVTIPVYTSTDSQGSAQSPNTSGFMCLMYGPALAACSLSVLKAMNRQSSAIGVGKCLNVGPR